MLCSQYCRIPLWGSNRTDFATQFISFNEDGRDDDNVKLTQDIIGDALEKHLLIARHSSLFTRGFFHGKSCI
jgi:hypothetical protein